MKGWQLITRIAAPWQIDSNFEDIEDRSRFVFLQNTEFVDAVAGAVTKNLQNGNKTNKAYCFIKTDASVNAVTIYPFAGQFINGGASTTLAAQGDKVTLIFDPASQSWWNV